MSDEGFPEFEDFLADFKPGEKHPIATILRYRQGGSSTSWISPGNQKYVPSAWQMQVGCNRWTGTGRLSGVMEFNYPQAFLSEPTVLATPIATTPAFQSVWLRISQSSGATCEVWWWSSVNLTSVIFNWLAIGPIGT